MSSRRTPAPATNQDASHGHGQASVLAVAEMNLEEYPAFRLGRRSKRPEIRYTRTRTEADGRVLEQVWVVRGAEGLGLPGPFEQDLYVALLVLFTEQGLPADGRIRFTRNRLAQVMGCSNSGRGYELIEQGLSRLAGASVHTEHAFYRPGAVGPGGARTGPAERLSLDFHVLEEVRVYERRPVLEPEPVDPAAGGTHPRVEHARPLELSVARLGQPLVQSYERRYTKGLDATYYFSLERPLAKRLYRYLDKVRNGRGSFEIGLLALADVLGLEYRYPSDVKDGLAEAHAELQATGYLTSAGYAPLAGGPRAGEKVVYAVDPAFDRRPRRRAGAAGTTTAGAAAGVPGAEHRPAASAEPPEPPAPSPGPAQKSALQLELESFGISPSRAASLVAQHPEDHVLARLDYVRELLRRPGATRLKNPAGFLARAIEEGYNWPESSPRATGQARAAGAPSGGGAAPNARFRFEPAGSVAIAEAPGGWHQDSPPAMAVETEARPAETAHGVEPGGATSGSGGGSTTTRETDPRWSQLAAALRERVSAATYAAWIAPACPLSPAPAGGEAGQLTVVVPSAFALDRWRRPPLAPALREAAAALGLEVALQVQPAAAEGGQAEQA